jgi:hypothetical protein
MGMSTSVVPALVKSSIVGLKSLGLDEAFVEKFIAEDPSVLGLGNDLKVLERQRQQEKGRLDLLLQDGAQNRRFEVELMLGELDASHLVRTIEYWDIERRRYPAYEHCAVVIAENITARFLNVITLFSGSISLIALQMSAVKVADKTGVVFLKVVDSRKLRSDDSGLLASSKSSSHDEWAKYAGSAVMDVVDKCCEIIKQESKRERSPYYTSGYVGMTDNGRSNLFVYFVPNKSSLWIFTKLDPAPWETRVQEAGLDSRSDGDFRVKVTPKDFSENEQLIREMLIAAVKQDEEA